MELGDTDDYVTIGSVLAGSGYEPYKRVKRRGNWTEATAYESPGVMQLTLDGNAWRVVGCAMDVFEM